jgi:hypothetical protein
VLDGPRRHVRHARHADVRVYCMPHGCARGLDTSRGTHVFDAAQHSSVCGMLCGRVCVLTPASGGNAGSSELLGHLSPCMHAHALRFVRSCACVAF